MITRFSIYERFKYPIEFEVGDIVISRFTLYSDSGNWLHEGSKYRIVELDRNNMMVKVQEVGKDKILDRNFKVGRFISLEEWEFNHDVNKYNL